MVQRGMSRRTFLKFSAAMATTLALPMSYAPRIAAAVTAAPRIPVIWLRGQACGGETRAFMQASDPTTAELLLEVLSVDYDQTIMARSGASAELARVRTMEAAPNGYIAVIEGAIPLGDDGVACMVGGRAFGDVAREVCGGAMATIAVGSCAFDGGAPGASGGTTGAVGAGQVASDAPLINLPGCPINVANLTATVVHYLTFKAWPATDARHRPLFAYGGLIHNQCERRAYFEFGEFVRAWGDEGSQKGWCLYKMGCKGPEAFANCPTVRFADGTSWPVKAGHGCIGCTTAGFWDAMGPPYARLPSPLPFAPSISADQLGVALVGGVAALTVVHGGASAVRQHRTGVAGQRIAGATEVAAGPAAADDVEASAPVGGAPGSVPDPEPSVVAEPGPGGGSASLAEPGVSEAGTQASPPLTDIEPATADADGTVEPAGDPEVG